MNQKLQEGGAILPEDTDILCGKSRNCVNHIGSRRYRDYLDTYRGRYASATTKNQKMLLIKEIHKNLSPTCRFLAFNKRTGEWEELSASKARDKIGHALRHANATRDEATGEPDTNSPTLSSVLCHMHAANQGAAQSIAPCAAHQYDRTFSPAIEGGDATVLSLKTTDHIDDGNVAIGAASQGPSIRPPPYGLERDESRKRSQIPEAPTSLTERPLNFAIQEPQFVFPFAALHPNPLAAGRTHHPKPAFVPNYTADKSNSIALSDETPTSDTISLPQYYTEDRLHPSVRPSRVLHHMNHTLADEARKSSAIVEMSAASTRTTLFPLQHPQIRGQTNSQPLATLNYPGHATSNTAQAIGASFVACPSSSSAWGIVEADQMRSFAPQAYFPSLVADSEIVDTSARRDTAHPTLTLALEDQQQHDVIGSDLEMMMKEPIQEWGETPSSGTKSSSSSG